MIMIWLPFVKHCRNIIHMQKLLKLFTTTFYISMFTFGGGFVIVTFMKKKFVDELGWINEEEMLDYAAIAQSSPGAIAVNTAILVGFKIKGIVGMLVAVLGTILPPMIIITAISFIYDIFITNEIVKVVLEGMQIGVAAVILSVSLDLGTNVIKEKSLLFILIIIAAFIADMFFNINVVFIILACAVIGILRLVYQRSKQEAL